MGKPYTSGQYINIDVLLLIKSCCIVILLTCPTVFMNFYPNPNLPQVMLMYYILPTQLFGHVPALFNAICVFVWAMRRLSGQVHSYKTASDRGILPGSRTVEKSQIRKMHADLIRGLSLLEGCLPLSHLKPGLHHFVHYAMYTSTHGCLRPYWMMCFERYRCLVII